MHRQATPSGSAPTASELLLPDEPEFTLDNCRRCLTAIGGALPGLLTAAESKKAAPEALVGQMTRSLNQLNWMMSPRGSKREQLAKELQAVDQEMLDSALVSKMVDLVLALLDAGSADEVAIRVLLGFLTASDRSLDFCLRFVQQDKFFRVYYPKLLKRQDGTKMLAMNTAGLVECAIGIAFNLYFKNNSEILRIMADYDLVDCTKPYLVSPVTRVSATALVFMAFAVDERQAEIFQGAKRSINYLIGVLHMGLKSPVRTHDGYDVTELSKSINRLALNDSNKDLLIELNVLSVIKLMLASDDSQDIQDGLELLFTLSFSEQNSQRIWTEFEESLQRLGASEQWSSCRQLQGLQFRLRDRRHQRPPSAVTPGVAKAKQNQPGSRRVMISYNHASKDQVAKLYRQLTEHQLDVWIDFQHLREGSTLDAMSEAVESSCVVLLCVTRLYKESNNCRLEAEYAWKCNKKLVYILMEPKYKATGWLGILMGTQLYYDLTETRCKFEDKFAELLPVILGHLDAAASSAGGQAAASAVRREHRLPTPPPPPLLPPIVARQTQAPAAAAPGSSGFRSWDADRVAAWCRERHLCQCVSELRLTGCELHFLMGAMARSPEFFGRLLERHFGFERLHDMAAFVGALEDLGPAPAGHRTQ